MYPCLSGFSLSLFSGCCTSLPCLSNVDPRFLTEWLAARQLLLCQLSGRELGVKKEEQRRDRLDGVCLVDRAGSGSGVPSSAFEALSSSPPRFPFRSQASGVNTSAVVSSFNFLTFLARSWCTSSMYFSLTSSSPILTKVPGVAVLSFCWKLHVLRSLWLLRLTSRNRLVARSGSLAKCPGVFLDGVRL